ncbi:Protein gts1 [Elasticomyces elasticus]|nr:Protein gts1 [Elasticomyces elasticus]
MDQWSNEQVDNMKRIGNVESNRLYNPSNTQPAIPVDVDEVEAVMERYIRQKYESKTLSGGSGSRPSVRQNTGSTSTTSRSLEEPPPSLPPKPSKRFGFNLRSASSTFHRPRAERHTPPLSPAFSGSDDPPSPPRALNKASRVFGSNVKRSDDNFDGKLATLREMGFRDSRRNSTILKDVNGNLDRAVESLVRLGEAKSASRALTPVSMGSNGNGVAGLTIERRRGPATVNDSSSPFEVLDLPQRAVTQPVLQRSTTAPVRAETVSHTYAYNPFIPASQQQDVTPALELSFQNLQVDQPDQQQQQQQPYLNSGPHVQSQAQYNPFHQPHVHQPVQEPSQSYNGANAYPQQAQWQQAQLPVRHPRQTSNPFLRSTGSQTFTSSNPFDPVPSQNGIATNPWQQQAPGILQTQSPAAIYVNQPDFFSQSVQPVSEPHVPQNDQRQYYPQSASPNPFQPSVQQQLALPQQYQQQQQQPPGQQPYQQHQPMQHEYEQQQQPYLPPQPFRHDKTSILALYNHPHLAPARPLIQSIPEIGPTTTTAPAPPSSPPKQRSATMPASASSGSRNPFSAAATTAQSRSEAGQRVNAHANGGGGGGGGDASNGARHVSADSVDFVGLAAGASGRHSPDAFAGLSARFLR